MAKVYQARSGDRYLSRVEFGGEHLLRIDVPPLHPRRPWVNAPPYGALIVLVTAVTPAGVEEETQVISAGNPERLGVGWKYAGRGALLQVFKRVRTHDVIWMPEVQAEGLLARLRSREAAPQDAGG